MRAHDGWKVIDAEGDGARERLGGVFHPSHDPSVAILLHDAVLARVAACGHLANRYGRRRTLVLRESDQLLQRPGKHVVGANHHHILRAHALPAQQEIGNRPEPVLRIRGAIIDDFDGGRALPRARHSLASEEGADSVGCTFIRSNFRYPERQREEPVYARYFRTQGVRVLTLPRALNFEGEGDALWVGHTLFLGFRFRSDAATHERLAALLKRRVLPLELKDKRFYHLDTCFCPLGSSGLLWYPKAFDRYGRKVIEDAVTDLIAVSEADALKFSCNAIVAGRHVVLHRGLSAALRRQLTRRGYQAHEVDLSEFLKAGGSAKCLVLTLPRNTP